MASLDEFTGSANLVAFKLVNVYHDEDKDFSGDHAEEKIGEIVEERNEADVQDAKKANDPVGCTGEDLTKFELFSNFPTETRIEIWKHALPVSNDGSAPFLFVKLNFLSDTAADGLVTLFSYHPKFQICGWGPSSTTVCSTSLELSLLAACRESRNVYIDEFPLCLPATRRSEFVPRRLGIFPTPSTFAPKGVIRYNEDTTVFISNLHDCVLKTPLGYHGQEARIRAALDAGLKLQNWWSEIRNLAILFDHDYNPSWDDYRDGMTPDFDISTAVGACSKLETFTYLVDIRMEEDDYLTWSMLDKDYQRELELEVHRAVTWLANRLDKNAKDKGLLNFEMPSFVAEFGSKVIGDD